ncbi:MAG TPA: Gfo/Idh/MocA family oxidoreductase [Candidatus Dormibacteraeota bacterium]|nr:Gfo/Idh/MocA family oxidoreductase [Candidatus Dormibacteraeota bacterium]
MTEVGIGLLGSGSAGHLYLRQARERCSLRYVACADTDRDRAVALATEYGLPRGCTPGELLADPAVHVVVNLTPPPLHGRTGLDVLQAGKHLYGEKPLAADLRQARRLLNVAEHRRLRVGCAPDTFLGPALQTARRLVDGGRIGAVFGASIAMVASQPESWHPRPENFYGEAAGPLFDMGPYYLTALVFLLGPVARVAGFSTTAPRERRPLGGAPIVPLVPTHEVGVLEFGSGAVASLTVSFDAAASATPPIEVHGSEGSMLLPDPNGGAGPVHWCRHDRREWVEEPHVAAGGQTRCAGVEDMVTAIAEDRPHRANGALALHVLDVMESLRRAAKWGRVVRLRTTCERPEPLPTTDKS